MNDLEILSLDVESHLIEPQGTKRVNTRHQMPPLVCMQTSLGDEHLVWDYTEIADLLDYLRRSKFDAIFGWNFAFDAEVLTNECAEMGRYLKEMNDEGKILDGMIMYLLRNPDPKPRLSSLAHVHKIAFPYEKALDKGTVRMSFRRGEPLTAEQRAYAIQDSREALRLANWLLTVPLGELRTNHRYTLPKQFVVDARGPSEFSPDVEYSRAAVHQAWTLSTTGMAIDGDKLQRYNAELKVEVGELESRMIALRLARMIRLPGAKPKGIGMTTVTGRSWTLTSTSPPRMQRMQGGVAEEIEGRVSLIVKDIRALFAKFAEENDIEPPLSVKTRQVSTSRDDWRQWEHDLPPELQHYMLLQKKRKSLASFTAPLVDARATEVFPRYYIPGAPTGRWAARHPSIMNAPKSHRDLYVPRPGNHLVYADFPSLELYTLSHAMECMDIEGPLKQILEDGVDPHTYAAAMVFDIAPEDVTPDQRQGAKAANFGLPGGMGVPRFKNHARGYGLEWSYEQAREMKALWFSKFTDVAQYIRRFKFNVQEFYKPANLTYPEWIQKLGFDVEADGWPSGFEMSGKIHGGRHYACVLPSGRMVPDRRYTDAMNCMFQGTGADVTTKAFNNLAAHGHYRIAAVIHDSFTVEVPFGLEEPAALDIAQAMNDALAFVCPGAPSILQKILSEIEVQKCWK